jgi:hypothetical protein
METKENILEPLLERVEEYSKTSFELIKLKSAGKTADIVSAIFSRLVLIPALMLLIISLSIACALWLGDVLGKAYYGFLIVAGMYAIICCILYFFAPKIKAKTSSFIITQILK